MTSLINTGGSVPYVGAKLARALHDRLPDWPTRRADDGAVDMDDPAGVWHLHIGGDGHVDLDQRDRNVGHFNRPDPGAVVAFLGVYLMRAEVRR